MTRRLLPLLIAFFLLMSQQVASTHVYSHFAGLVVHSAAVAQHRAAASADEPTAIEQLCGLCLAAADLAFAVPGKIFQFDLAAEKLQQLVILCTQPLEKSTNVVFLSRAPPLQ
jgi:hypothetical protein